MKYSDIYAQPKMSEKGFNLLVLAGEFLTYCTYSQSQTV